MPKIKEVRYIHPETGEQYHHRQFAYGCLGCGYEHFFALKSEGGNHDFNMDLNSPTVTPSLLQNFDPARICHSFIANGKIQFLGDCWHLLKNQTVDLPEVDP